MMNRKKISTPQSELLVKFMEEHPWMICGRIDSTFTRQDKEREWKGLTDELNTLGCAKSTEKWLKTWSDMKVAAKKKLSIYKRDLQFADGVFTNSIPPSTLEERIGKLIDTHVIRTVPFILDSATAAMNDIENKDSILSNQKTDYESELINASLCSETDVKKYKSVQETGDFQVKEDRLSEDNDNSDEELTLADIKLRIETGPYTCEYCKVATFPKIEELHHHYISCQKKATKLKKESFSETPHRTEKKRKRDTDKMYSCEICQVSFKHQVSLTKHVRSHAKKHECNICEIKFRRSSELMYHLNNHTFDEPEDNIKSERRKRDNMNETLPEEQFYYCYKCNEKFTSSQQFESHALTHTTDNDKDPSRLSNDTFTATENFNKDTSIFSTEKPYVCSICNQGFSFECNLKIHVKLHGTESFSCKICNKFFPSDDHLKKHVSLHDKGTLYSCIVCDKNFVKASHLTDHLKTHKCNKLFKCDTCFNSFYSSRKLEEHKKSHIKGDFICNVCKEVFRNKLHLERHIKAHYETSKFESFLCDICQESFNSLSGLKKHKMMDHPGVKRYKCEICRRGFDNINLLQIHISSHMNIKRYSCRKCDKTFALKLALDAHESVHGDHTYSCEFCGVIFTTRSELNEHEKKHKKEEKYVCEICGKISNTQSVHRAHRQTHEVGQPLPCQICGKFFNKPHLLYAHQMRHNDTRPHSCDQCEWTFKSRGALKTHYLRKHSNERPHICSICGEAFALAVDLKFHEYRHTGLKPHVCQVCGQAFTRMYILKLHQTIHTGNMPYACGICGKKFIKRFRMRRHEQTHKIIDKDSTNQSQKLNKDVTEHVNHINTELLQPES